MGGKESFSKPFLSALPWISSERNAAHRGDPYALHAQQLLSGSGFYVSSEGGNTGFSGIAAWGRVSTGGFDTEIDNIKMDGRATTGLLGVDASWNRLTAGVLVSRSQGRGSYSFNRESDTKNEIESTLTGFYPSAWLRLNPSVSLWGLVGIGFGDLTLLRKGESPVETDLDMQMGAIGVKGRLFGSSGLASGAALAVKSDAMWVRTKSATTDQLEGIQGKVTRIRLLLEGSRSFEAGEGAIFTPTGEVGLRHDGGDAETGTGLEVGAGGRLIFGPLTVEGKIRTLVVHEDQGYREWGASGAIRYRPVASEQGFKMSISPTWGNTASASNRLWTARDASMLSNARNYTDRAGGRLDAELGYGMDLLGSGDLFTPFATLSLEENGFRSVRTGAMWKVAPGATLSLEGTRFDTRGEDVPVDAMLIRATLRF